VLLVLGLLKMAGDLTASIPTVCSGAAAVKTAVDLLNLAATTDVLHVVPVSGHLDTWLVFKVERAA